MTSKRTKLLVLASAVAMTAAACGSSSKSTASSTTAAATTSSAAAASTTTAATSSSAAASSTTAAAPASSTTAAAADPLGTPNKATGTPIKIGYFGDGASAAIDNTDEMLTAQAVAKYINDYMGGIGGHPIDLQTCIGKQDVAIATDCANKFVQAGYPAVIFNVSGSSAAFAKPIQAAKIALFAWQAADIASEPNTTFVFSNGLSSFLQPAAEARDNKFTKGTIGVIDVPGASGPAKSLGVGIMKKAGVAAPDVVAIAPGTADMVPQFQAAMNKGPQIIHLIGDSTWCTSALKALKSNGYTGEITMISQCMSDATVKAIGDYLKGAKVGYSGTTDPNDPDYKQFVAIVNKYAADPSKISLTSNPVGAYGAMMSFARIFQKYTGDATSAAMAAFAKAMPATPLPLGAGASYKCDGKAVSILPAICTASMVEATLDASGKPTNFKAVDAGDLLVLG